MDRNSDKPDLLRPDPATAGLWTGILPSGLRLIVREDHRLPVAVANVWVRVGSNREPDDLRGWSHGIEHMLFKGTERRGEDDFAREVAAAGGITNAGTGYETTNYHITVPAAGLPVAVDLLGDALFHSTFAAEALEPEREVLVHENHMYDDQPFGFGLTWRLGLERALDVSPYRHPIGGCDANLRERSRDDIVAFWRAAYRPDNMTVVVVGDVEPAAAAALVARSFPATPHPPSAADLRVQPVANPPVEPPHAAARLRRLTGEIGKAYAKLIFPAPGEDDPRRDVLPVVRRVLGDGRSCRLNRRVREQARLVDNFVVATEIGPREGVVIIDLETGPTRLREAVAAVTGILGELGRDGCTTAEQARAVTRVRRSHLFGLETIEGQAANLGYHDAIGDLPNAFTLPERVAAVTPDQVAGLCRDLFRPATTTLMLYLPDGADQDDLPQDDAALQALLEESFLRGAPADDAPINAVPPPPARPVGGPAPAETGFRQRRLAGGVDFHWRRDPAVPVVALSFGIPGGAAGETAADAGLSALTRAVQLKGADGRSAAELHGDLEDLGAALSPRGGRDHDGFLLSALADQLEPALELAGDVLLRPDFPAEEIDQERRLALAQLEAWQDDPFQAAVLAMRSLLYGDHPYGRPLVGTPASLPGLGAAQLRDRHARTWRASGLQVVACGDLDPDRLADHLENLFGPLAAADAGTAPDWPGPARRLEGVSTERLTRRRNQCVILQAWPGPPDAVLHRVPLLLLRQALNGQSGRLFAELRNRRSLCYNTGMVGTAGRSQGMLLGYVLTAPDTAEDAREALRDELLRAAAERIPDAEFTRARAELEGNLLIGDQANAPRADRLLGDLLLDRPRPGLAPLLDEVAACTPEDVRTAAAVYLRGDAYAEIVLGPEGN